MRMRTLLRVPVLTIVLAAAPSLAAPHDPAIEIGDMGGTAETRGVLRRLLGEESDRRLHGAGASEGGFTPPERAGGPGGPHRSDARYELTGSARLVRVPDATGVVLSCEVSLLLVEKPAGTVRALLRGRAHLARDRKRPAELGGDAADVEEAVRIAVRGALRTLPEALGLGRGDAGGAVSPQSR